MLDGIVNIPPTQYSDTHGNGTQYTAYNIQHQRHMLGLNVGLGNLPGNFFMETHILTQL